MFVGAVFVPKTKFCVGGRPGGSVSADRSRDGKKHFWAFGGPEVVDFFALKARAACAAMAARVGRYRVSRHRCG